MVGGSSQATTAHSCPPPSCFETLARVRHALCLGTSSVADGSADIPVRFHVVVSARADKNVRAPYSGTLSAEKGVCTWNTMA